MKNEGPKNSNLHKRALSSSRYKSELYPGVGAYAILPYYLQRAAGYFPMNEIHSHALEFSRSFSKNFYKKKPKNEKSISQNKDKILNKFKVLIKSNEIEFEFEQNQNECNAKSFRIEPNESNAKDLTNTNNNIFSKKSIFSNNSNNTNNTNNSNKIIFINNTNGNGTGMDNTYDKNETDNNNTLKLLDQIKKKLSEKIDNKYKNEKITKFDMNITCNENSIGKENIDNNINNINNINNNNYGNFTNNNIKRVINNINKNNIIDKNGNITITKQNTSGNINKCIIPKNSNKYYKSNLIQQNKENVPESKYPKNVINNYSSYQSKESDFSKKIKSNKIILINSNNYNNSIDLNDSIIKNNISETNKNIINTTNNDDDNKIIKKNDNNHNNNHNNHNNNHNNYKSSNNNWKNSPNMHKINNSNEIKEIEDLNLRILKGNNYINEIQKKIEKKGNYNYLKKRNMNDKKMNIIQIYDFKDNKNHNNLNCLIPIYKRNVRNDSSEANLQNQNESYKSNSDYNINNINDKIKTINNNINNINNNEVTKELNKEKAIQDTKKNRVNIIIKQSSFYKDNSNIDHNSTIPNKNNNNNNSIKFTKFETKKRLSSSKHSCSDLLNIKNVNNIKNENQKIIISNIPKPRNSNNNKITIDNYSGKNNDKNKRNNNISNYNNTITCQTNDCVRKDTSRNSRNNSIYIKSSPSTNYSKSNGNINNNYNKDNINNHQKKNNNCLVINTVNLSKKSSPRILTENTKNKNNIRISINNSNHNMKKRPKQIIIANSLTDNHVFLQSNSSSNLNKINKNNNTSNNESNKDNNNNYNNICNKINQINNSHNEPKVIKINQPHKRNNSTPSSKITQTESCQMIQKMDNISVEEKDFDQLLKSKKLMKLLKKHLYKDYKNKLINNNNNSGKVLHRRTISTMDNYSERIYKIKKINLSFTYREPLYMYSMHNEPSNYEYYRNN